MIAKLPLIYAALVAAMIVPGPAQARGKGTGAEERLIADCIYRSARGRKWLESVLWAIRHQEGGWIGAQVRNRNGSHDLGPMQINSWWVPRFATLFGRSPLQVQQWLRQDACFNVEAARYILLNELDLSGDVWIALGRYHSTIESRQRSYAIEVEARLLFFRSQGNVIAGLQQSSEARKIMILRKNLNCRRCR